MPTPEFISRAAYDAARAGHTFYTHTAGYAELREAIARRSSSCTASPTRPSEIMCTVGASMAIYRRDPRLRRAGRQRDRRLAGLRDFRQRRDR